MGLILKDLERIGKDLELSDQAWEIERASRQEWIDRTSSNDTWAKKIFKDVGILMTSHTGNRPYLKACIESHLKLGYWITLAYDNYINPEWPVIDHDNFLPSKDVMDNIDSFFMSHHQVWGGVMYPWFWLMKWGTDLLQQFEYIYCVNGDFVIEKPEGFKDLMAMLGDGDIMSYGPSLERSESTCFIARSSALKRIMQHFQDHFIPWDKYEAYTQEYGNPESRFAIAIRELGLKRIIVPESPFNEQMHLPGYGTWYKLLGFRHIHGEHNYAYRHKGIPPHFKYLDSRFMGDEYNQIKSYYELVENEPEKAKKVLEDWWAKDG